MYQTIHTSKIHENAIRSDILNNSNKYLTFFKLGNNFFSLLLELRLNKRLMRNNHVLEFLVDLYNAKIHFLANVHVVIPYWLNINLATGQECLQSQHIND